MRQLLTRSFTVAASPEATWSALTDAQTWPNWARHIRRIELTPAGPVSATTSAEIVLVNRTKARVAVSEFEPGRRFRWEGRFLWLGLGYDHVAEPADRGSRVTFVVDGAGAGIGSIGRLFARMYARNLDRAIPNLQAQLSQSGHDHEDLTS